MLTDTDVRKAKPADGRTVNSMTVACTWKSRRPAASCGVGSIGSTAGKSASLLVPIPDIVLAEAREKHAAARKLLAAGIDPGEHRKAEKAAATERAANSYEVIAREWLAKQTWARCIARWCRVCPPRAEHFPVGAVPLRVQRCATWN